VYISRAQLDDLIAHARDEQPNECCGYMTIKEGSVEQVVRARNERESPYGYQLDADAQLKAWRLAEDDGYQIAVYHSHPRSAPEPSQTDINLAVFPEWLQVIVSLAGEPEARVWRIADGHVEEEPLTVD